MSIKNEIKKEVEVVGFLKDLVEVYGEIASLRMMKIRSFVLNNREYIFSITQIFYDALAAYLRKVSRREGTRRVYKNERITFLSHNGKTVFVFVSANTGFYGDVIATTFKRFSDEFVRSNAEVAIIGKVGRSIFTEKFPGKPYTFFDLPDYGSNKDKLAALVNHLVQYDEVKVYYSAYDSVVNQRAQVSELTAGAKFIEKAQETKDDYIFEPTPEEILIFFEKEVFGSFFDQAIRESQLSKLSGRVMAMDKASVSIKKRLGEINFEFLKAKHRLINKKQLGLLTAFTN